MSLTKKSFTLIEMLIVVVIIGILAAALIPRLQGVQGRARDVQRKTGLSQIGQGMGVYRQDSGNYSGAISSSMPSSGTLVPSYLASLPTDPKGTSWVLASDFTTTNGNYAAWSNAGGDILLLAARTEIRGSSNGSGVTIAGTTDMSGLQAKLLTATSQLTSLTDGHAGLRYYYAQ